MKIGFEKEQIIMLFSANFPFLSRWMVDLHAMKKSERRIVFHSQSRSFQQAIIFYPSD